MPDRKVPQDVPQSRQKHPDEYQRDLNPDHMAGQNVGGRSTLDDPHGHLAADVKELVTRLHHEFRMDELREIPVLTRGARLEQGAVYLDLSDPSRQPFTAMGADEVKAGSYVVAKQDCPVPYWNRLLGMKDPRRTI